jgi:hypothetical protein
MHVFVYNAICICIQCLHTFAHSETHAKVEDQCGPDYMIYIYIYLYIYIYIYIYIWRERERDREGERERERERYARDKIDKALFLSISCTRARAHTYHGPRGDRGK